MLVSWAEKNIVSLTIASMPLAQLHHLQSRGSKIVFMLNPMNKRVLRGSVFSLLPLGCTEVELVGVGCVYVFFGAE